MYQGILDTITNIFEFKNFHDIQTLLLMERFTFSIRIFNMTAFIFTAQNGHTEIVRELLSTKKHKYNNKNIFCNKKLS